MIAVRARDGVVACVEIRTRAIQTRHPDIVGKVGVPRTPELARGQAWVVVEVDDLPPGVNAGIGAARCHDTRSPENPLEGILASTLNGDRVGLSLPPAIRGSIVLEDGSDAQTT
jgi:hypothetical protein